MSLLQEFRNLIGKKVTYSRCGGGNGSILLITFCCMEDNRPDIVSYNLWAWWYWILLCNGEKCADACDDVTAIVGKAVLEVKKLEGQTVVNVFTDIYANLFNVSSI